MYYIHSIDQRGLPTSRLAVHTGKHTIAPLQVKYKQPAQIQRHYQQTVHINGSSDTVTARESKHEDALHERDTSTKHQHGRVCSAPVVPKRTAQRVGQTRHIGPVQNMHQHGRVCSAPVIPKRTAQRVGQTRHICPVRKRHQHGRVCSAPVIPKRTAQGVGQTKHICPRLADQAKHCTKEVPARGTNT